VALWVGVVLLGNSWFQLLLAGVLGLLLAQFGFLGHDAAHRQIFARATWNDGAARILSGIAGLSFTWWRSKHNRHHNAPNQSGKDPDVGPGLIAFTAEVAADRTTGLKGWFTRRQGWLFFPLLTLEGISLHVGGLQTLLSRGRVPHRGSELSIILTRMAVYFGALLVLLPAGKAAAFVAVQVAVFGVYLGAAFAPNHTGMPIVPRTSRIDFLQRQVLMSRNVRGGPWLDEAMGGLNFQIEHHLFPSMPRPNLRRVEPLVRAHCAALEVPYTEVSLPRAYAIVIDYLNNVGLRARAPFDCPLATQLRD
jgi:fatty acid desaturase